MESPLGLYLKKKTTFIKSCLMKSCYEYETVVKSCLPGPCAMVGGPIVFIYSCGPGPGKNSWIPDGYYTYYITCGNELTASNS